MPAACEAKQQTLHVPSVSPIFWRKARMAFGVAALETLHDRVLDVWPDRARLTFCDLLGDSACLRHTQQFGMAQVQEEGHQGGVRGQDDRSGRDAGRRDQAGGRDVAKARTPLRRQTDRCLL